MNGFFLSSVPEIVAGAGRIASAGGDVARLAGERAPVMLVSDPALSELGVAGRVADAIATAGHTIQRYENISSDATEAQVATGARIAREMGATIVVGLGGGSVLDAAKMIAVLGAEDVDVPAFRLAAAPLPERRLALLCAPTTGGTGSEATATSVLSSEDGTKFWYWGGALKPDFIILDPELATTLPAPYTAATGVDALVHAMEAATNRNSGSINDLYAMEAIRLLAAHLPTAMREPEDLDARLATLTAACLAGIAIDNAGTGLAHNIGHALGSLMPIHHGRAVAIAMAATLPWVIEGNEDGFARIADALGADGAAALPDRFAGMLADLRIDTTLPAPVDAGDLAARMAAPENSAMRASTARIVSDDDLMPLAERVVAFAAGRPRAA